MIQRDFIAAWRQKAPWPTDAQVDQDLVLSRALVEIFRIRYSTMTVMTALRETLDPWLETPKRNQSEGRRVILSGHALSRFGVQRAGSLILTKLAARMKD